MEVQCKARRVVINAYKDGELAFSEVYYDYCGKSLRKPFPTEEKEGYTIDLREYELATIGWCSDEEVYLTFEEDIEALTIKKSKILLPNGDVISINEYFSDDSYEEDMQFLDVDVCTKDSVENVDYSEWMDYVDEHEDLFSGYKDDWGDEGIKDPFSWE